VRFCFCFPSYATLPNLLHLCLQVGQRGASVKWCAGCTPRVRIKKEKSPLLAGRARAERVVSSSGALAARLESAGSPAGSAGTREHQRDVVCWCIWYKSTCSAGICGTKALARLESAGSPAGSAGSRESAGCSSEGS
jgi:hypothetical protein